MLTSSHERLEEIKEEQRIAREAREIERRAGGRAPGRLHRVTGGRHQSPPLAAGRTPTASQTDMTETELTMANANLMARAGAVHDDALSQLPITIFFYNHEQSRSQDGADGRLGPL